MLSTFGDSVGGVHGDGGVGDNVLVDEVDVGSVADVGGDDSMLLRSMVVEGSDVAADCVGRFDAEDIDSAGPWLNVANDDDNDDDDDDLFCKSTKAEDSDDHCNDDEIVDR